jgi:hypothetical protein
MGKLKYEISLQRVLRSVPDEREALLDLASS